MKGKEEKCWLCLRITPQQLSKAIHLLFPKDIAHSILMEATECISYAYEQAPERFCGKSAYRIIGGLMYVLAKIHGHNLTMLAIADTLAYLRTTVYDRRDDGSLWGVQVTIRYGVKDWMDARLLRKWRKLK